MSGRLKSQVDMEELKRSYEHTGSYAQTARIYSESYGLPITGPHVRYWLSSADVVHEQKVLLFDIETAPMEAYWWGS